MDIRRYFSASTTIKKTNNSDVKSKKNNADFKKKEKEEGEDFKIKKRKKPTIILSDSESEEDPIPKKLKNEKKAKTPEKKIQKTTPPSKKQKNSKSPILHLQPVKSAKDFFGDETIKRSKHNPLLVKQNEHKTITKDVSEEMEIHDDDDFIETLKQLDYQEQIDKIDDTSNHSSKSCDTDKINKINSERMNGEVKAETKSPSPAKATNSKTQLNKRVSTADKRLSIPESNQVTRSSPRKPVMESPSPKKPLKVEPKTPVSEEKVKNHESYRNYLNRAGPQALGSKPIPEGTDGCLQGLTFVITGVLESLEREDVADLIKKYNGRVTQSISKNTRYIIVGRDAGPSKLEKAAKLGTKCINEDQFLNLIVEKSQSKTSPSKKVSISASLEKKVASVKEEKTIPTMKHEIRKTLSPTDKKSKVKVNFEKSNELPKKDDVSLLTGIHERSSSEDALLWVDKYKPTMCKQIIGQQGDRSNMNKLKKWLSNWHQNNSGQQEKKKPGRWGSGNDDGSSFKAALLSGPPGIGKSTTASLVCKELGFTFTELNASDTRSKKSLQSEVQELLTNSSLIWYQSNENVSFSSKHCLLMDEVDGMAGNEDRGGVQELIQLIKISKIPIICMCNDRNHPKIRSLSNYCFDLRFMRPRTEQLKAAMMSVCYKENITITPQALQEIIIAANQDVRQTLHHLSLWSAKDKSLSADDAHKEAQKSKKDQKLNPFDTLRKVFSAEDQKSMSIHDKTELFFYDYSIAPLFVQENYVHMNPAEAKGDKKKTLQLLSETADAISDGDHIDKLIRSSGHWNLLPTQAIFASVIPGNLMSCYNVPHQVTFPNWLGKNSRRNKFHRMCHELAMHMRLRVSGNGTDVNLDYIPCLRDAIVRPLQQSELNGVHEALRVLQSYDILREDIDNILEISLWPGKTDPFSTISPKVKSAFTRAYNSSGILIPYASSSAGVKKKKVESVEFLGEEMLDESEEEDDENIGRDAMIKVKQPSKRQKKSDEPSSSNGKGKGRGKRSKN